jgi:hypothetical protein
MRSPQTARTGGKIVILAGICHFLLKLPFVLPESYEINAIFINCHHVGYQFSGNGKCCSVLVSFFEFILDRVTVLSEFRIPEIYYCDCQANKIASE